MTEQEWLACQEPRLMLDFLRGKGSERKLRLFGVACCHRIWHLVTDVRSRRAVEMTKRFVDSAILWDDWMTCSEEAHEAYRMLERQADMLKNKRAFVADCEAEAACHAGCAAYYVANHLVQTPDLLGNPMTVSSAVSNAVRYAEGIQRGITLTYSGEENGGVMRAAWLAEAMNHAPLIRCIFGNPFHPSIIDPSWLAWKDNRVVKLAQAIYDERAFDRMPELAGVLHDAGCDNDALLSHCRGPGPHVRGCWVVDILRGIGPLDRPDITFGEDGKYVSVWVGSFGSQQAVDEYLAEQYDDDREDEPISPFAADIGLKSYDHDFVETKFQKDLSKNGDGAFSGHSYGGSFAEEAWEAQKCLGLGHFDAVFLLYGYAHTRYPQAKQRPERVVFVGTFEYKDESRKYPTISQILGTIFAIDVGLSDDDQRQMLERSLANEHWRFFFERELQTAFSDTTISWSDLLSNDIFEVYQADTEKNAREFAVSLLWEPTFPGKAVPELE